MTKKLLRNRVKDLLIHLGHKGSISGLEIDNLTDLMWKGFGSKS